MDKEKIGSWSSTASKNKPYQTIKTMQYLILLLRSLWRIKDSEYDSTSTIHTF